MTLSYPAERPETLRPLATLRRQLRLLWAALVRPYSVAVAS